MDIQYICPSCGIRVVPTSDGSCPSCRTQMGVTSDIAPRLFVGDAEFSVPWAIIFWYSFHPRIKGEGTYEITDEGLIFRGVERDPTLCWPARVFGLLTVVCYTFLVFYAKVPLIRENPLIVMFVMYSMIFTANVLGQRERPAIVHAYWPCVEQILLPVGSLGSHVVVFMRGQKRAGAIYFIPETGREVFVAALPPEVLPLVIREREH